MMQYQTIVIGLGLDDRDEAVLRHAAQFAQAALSHVVYLAHVVRSFDLPHPTAVPLDEALHQRLEAQIASHRHLFPTSTVLHAVVREGSPAVELVRLAKQKSADLLCLGRQPAHEPNLLSESARRIAGKVPCSFFLIPTAAEPQYERILVPIDFSERSREALEVACAFAATHPATCVTALHVYDVPSGWHKTNHSYQEFAEIMRKHAERHWADFEPTVARQGVPVTIRLEHGEHIPATIEKVASEMQTNLLILSSHGHTQAAGFLLGHVADSVCERTGCPILCIKRKGEVVSFLRALLQFFESDAD